MIWHLNEKNKGLIFNRQKFDDYCSKSFTPVCGGVGEGGVYNPIPKGVVLSYYSVEVINIIHLHIARFYLYFTDVQIIQA